MPASVTPPPAVSRLATIATVVVVTLTGLGVAYKLVGNTSLGQKSGGSGSVLQIWASSGAQAGKMNSSGSLVLSGVLIISHRQNRTGALIINGNWCYKDPAGNLREVVETGGILRTRTPRGGDCTPGDAQ